MTSTWTRHTFVIPLTCEPGTDMYWHSWGVFVVEGNGVVWEKSSSRAKVEKIIESVKFSDYEVDEDSATEEEMEKYADTDYFKEKEYLEAVEVALIDAGYGVESQSVGSLAFPGGI